MDAWEEYDTRIAAHYRAYRPPLHAELLEAALGADQFQLGLDVGCGTGQSSVALTQFCTGVCGIEPNAAMLTLAPNHPRVSYLTGVQNFSEKVDLLCFFGSLHYIGKDEVGSYLRFLKSNGTVLCADFEVDYSDVLKALQVVLPSGDYDHQKNLISYGYASYTLEDQGVMPMTFVCSPEELGHLLLSAAVMQEAFETLLGLPDPYEAVVQKLKEMLPQKITISATGYFSRFLAQN